MENTNLKKLLVDELIEDKNSDDKIIKSFYSQESLNTDIFNVIDDSYKMNEGIRDKLLSIANTFIDFMGVTFFVYDIVLTGSLANYNWSEYSDVDLHIFIDINEFGKDDKNSTTIQMIMKEFFDSKEKNWKSLHNIKIKNFEVELYVQDINERHLSSGVYSVINDKWIIEPEKGKEGISEKEIHEKSEEYMSLIDDLIKKSDHGIDVSEESKEIKDKIKRFRQSGLETNGEYSYENLTFKLLRRNGYIGKLFNLRKDIIDKKLSVTQ